MLNKSTEFALNEQELAEFSKALSHPARISILSILAAENGCMCGDIVGKLPLAQSTVSQHLRSRREAGLIKGQIDGQKTNYCINLDNIRKFRTELNTWFEQTENACEEKNCC
jgi:DNA-binding transcriptional ArsR family regulator